MADLSQCLPLTRDFVFKAHELIKPCVHHTPVMTSRTLSQMASTPQRCDSSLRSPARPVFRLWFKCENLQRTGAFKARGAFHAIERLKQEPGFIEGGGLSRGVCGFSAGMIIWCAHLSTARLTLSIGNHAQALALAAKENGMPAHVVMPDTTRPSKIVSTKGYGAKVIICGPQDREVVAARVVAETGARLIPPFNHPDVILGQATVGLEFSQQVPELNAIITPCSGGGLLSGVALSYEGTGVRVFGAEPEFEGADDGRRGFLSGTRVTYVKTSTIADGLIGVVGPPSIGAHIRTPACERHVCCD